MEQLKINKLMKETLWSLLTKGITFVLFFLINIILARKLGVDLFGSWSFFYSALSIIFIISNSGLNASSKKYVAEYNKTSDLRGILKSSIKLRLFFSIALCTLFLFFARPIAVFLKRPELESLFLLAIPLVFFSSLVEFLKEIFIGLHRNKYNFIINLAEYGIKLVLLLSFFVFSVSLFSVVNSYTLALLVTSLVGFYLLYSNFYRHLEKSSKSFYKEIFNYSLPLFLINVGFWASTELNVLMIGLIKGNYEVGIFSVAKEIITKLPQISLAISMGTMPLFAKFDGPNREKLKRLFSKLLKINTAIFLPIALFLIIFSPILIPLFYGPKYSQSILPLQLLTPYMVFFSFSILLSTFLDYQGLAKKRAINLSVTIILNLVLNLLLIPRFGVSGSALALSVSYLPYLILNWLEVRRVLS